MPINAASIKIGINYVKMSNKIRGQSYKGSTIINYGSIVVIWGIFKSSTTLEL